MDSYISSKSEVFAVIGDPISHSLSPAIHNRIFHQMGMDRVYLALHIFPGELEASLGLLRKNLKGFNVTIPHKEAIMPLLDEIDERSKVYGAVNTVKLEEDGKLKGYNTDGYGFIKSLEAENLSVSGKRVLILGAGGAARVIAYELLMLGCSITIANRSMDKAKEVKAALEENIGGAQITLSRNEDLQGTYDLIVNTTPLGMVPKEKDIPVGEHIIQRASILYDLIYNPRQTKFLKIGEKYGCRTLNGFSMLFYQAVKAQEIWLGKSLKRSITDQVYQDMSQYLEEYFTG